MRAVLVAAVVTIAASAAAEPLPPGAIGVVMGTVAGTGADAKTIGAGYYLIGDIPIPGLQASWQPMSTERRLGWTVRGTLLFGTMFGGSAAQIESTLRTVQMDLTVGLRYRPWTTPSRYLTLRAGGELMRTNEPLPPLMNRAFAGGIASVGLDQYAAGFLFSVDVRYGLIGSGPGEIALLVGIGRAGP